MRALLVAPTQLETLQLSTQQSAGAIRVTASNAYVSQNVLSVMARFKALKKSSLQEALRRIRSTWYHGRTSDTHLSPMRYVDTLHFARFVIVEPNFEATSGHWLGHYGSDLEYRDYDPYLLFETWYDGPLDAHIDDLLADLPDLPYEERGMESVAGTIASLFSYCEDFEIPVDADAAAGKDYLRKFLKNNNFKHERANTPFIAARGRSKQQIVDEQEMYTAVRQCVDEMINNGEWRDRDPVRIHADLRQKFVDKEDGVEYIFFDNKRLGPPPPRLRGPAAAIDRANLGNYMWYVLAAVPGLLAAACIVGVIPSIIFLLRPQLGWAWSPYTSIALIAGFAMIAYLVIILRRHERRDDEYQIHLKNPAAYVKNEDHVLQNPMTSAIPVKHCRFRRSLLCLVLAVVRWDARYVATKGRLSGISSIHFARWTVVGDPPLLLFTSNYNRSWESYLGEFVDDAARGLTLIWSNAQGFPRTRWLITEGASNEQLFKAYSRQAMGETQLWYSAYWNITVLEILRNTMVREGLLKLDHNADTAADWVALL